MNRTNLDFLIPMFPFGHFSDFSILIINQTSENNLLNSDFSSVQVINSYEIGLSKSRNLGLEMSKKSILLISDDDEIFKEGFDVLIVDTYNNYPNAVVAGFQIENPDGNLFRKYLKETKSNLTKFDLFGIFSSEITINKVFLEKVNVKFDTNFGLGANFSMGEEAVFLMDLKKKNQQLIYMPKVIAINPSITTTDRLNFEERYYIQGAFLARVLKRNYRFHLAIKLFFDLKQRKLKITQISKAIKNAKLGKKDFYKLQNKKNA
ncbi:glycosyltransferase family A protein [Flavobacterium flavigenum]|uniref:glycosyltransferase family A protein n=1 Tax=Flavobacterium flavigenum TaxID=3003258 RepID=UPI00248263AE|nr:glycosyltransferase family A protein [Flavobacterium flavigenum]